MRFFRPLLQAAATPAYKKGLPDSSVYKTSTVALINHRLSLLESSPDVSAFEKQLNIGQIEELIEQANDELSLVSKMAEWKPWEPLEEAPAPGQWTYPGVKK
eukprot:jgi/Hompol1/6193/HPOL_004870-RA